MHRIQSISQLDTKINRKKRAINTLLVLVLIGIAYYIFISLTGLAIPCIFRQITSYKCPGCGITTMLVALAHGNINDAFDANPFLFITSPFLLVEFYIHVNCYIKEKQISKTNRFILLLYIIALIIFGIIRNM